MASPAHKSFDVAIIGGGLAGFTLAIALHKRGIRCSIYEQAAGLDETGATILVSRNAVNAMEMVDRSVLGAFNIVSTQNKSPLKRRVWFDFMDGMSEEPARHLQPMFSVIDHRVGHNVVHRARFLDELARLLPRDSLHFDKKLRHIVDETAEPGKMLLRFEDGSTAEADVVFGCDGVKSRTREIMVGEDHPAAKPSYTHKYAYRGRVSMAQAIQALGEERATNSSLWMGENRHVLTFPMDNGARMNVLAFVTNDRGDWPSTVESTLPTTKAEALDDFRNFGWNVKKILQLTKISIDKCAIFDLGDHSLSSYFKGRICLVGDAAHATSPHHGAGEGSSIEDSVLLASLMADAHIKTLRDLRAVFAVYDAHRRERTQWIVQSSRRAGNLVEYLAPGVGGDIDKIEKDMKDRLSQIWKFDLEDSVREAKKDLYRRLAVPGLHKIDSQELPFFANEAYGLEIR